MPSSIGVVREWGERMERIQTTIRLPAELKKKLEQEADRRGDSFNGLIIQLLEKQMEYIIQNQ